MYRPLKARIDYNGFEGVSGIKVFGGYEDYGDEIIYIAHGGNDSTIGKQVDHQSWNSPDNKSLVVSHRRKSPIHVLNQLKMCYFELLRK